MGKRKDNLDKILLNKTNETVKFKKNDFRIYKFSAHKCTELLLLVVALCLCSSEENYAQISLECIAWNTSAMKFYREYGAKRCLTLLKIYNRNCIKLTYLM